MIVSEVPNGSVFQVATAVFIASPRPIRLWSAVYYIKRGGALYELNGSPEPIDTSAWPQGLEVHIVDTT